MFVGTDTTSYVHGLFDVANRHKVFVLRPEGLESLTLPGIAKTGMSHQEVFDDVTAAGSIIPNGALRLALDASGVAAAPGIETCESYLAEGFKPGDANTDGVFNSADLVAIFQAGKYEDGVVGGTHWMHGDWNCDSEFDSSDLVVAFQGGSYLSSVAAAALVDSSDSSSVQATADRTLEAITGSELPRNQEQDLANDEVSVTIFHEFIDTRPTVESVDELMAILEM